MIPIYLVLLILGIFYDAHASRNKHRITKLNIRKESKKCLRSKTVSELP